MPFSWKDYLLLAERLANYPDTTVVDASFRTATSRAYYAAFGESRDYAVRKLGFVPTKKPEDHKLLRMAFESSGLTEIATSLDRLRGWRNACDYDGTLSVNAWYPINAVAEAKRVLQRLKN